MHTVRPRDYFDMFSPARQNRFCRALYELYAVYAGRQLANDCAQIAMLLMLQYRYPLEIGPSLTRERTAAWYSEAHDALLRFTKVRRFRGAVLKRAFKGNNKNIESLPEIDTADFLEDPEWDTAVHWVESNLYWGTVFKSLRTYIAELPDADDLELKVLDQLGELAIRGATDFRIEEIFRGENQIAHQALLEELQKRFPDPRWNIKAVRRLVEKLKRHAKRYRAALLNDERSDSSSEISQTSSLTPHKLAAQRKAKHHD